MTLSFLVVTLAQILMAAIILRAILSWFPGSRSLAAVAGALDAITEPVLAPLRRLLPTFGGLDLSPLVAVLLVGAVESFLLGALAGR